MNILYHHPSHDPDYKRRSDAAIAKRFLTHGTQKLCCLTLTIFLITLTFSYLLFSSSSKVRYNNDPGVLQFIYEQDRRFQEVKEIPIYTTENLPNASRFYRNHVSYGIPFVIRGLTSDWKAVKNWKDDEYLLDKIGKLMIEVETRKGEGNEFAFFQKEYTRTKITYKKFLSLYETENYYWAEQKVPAEIEGDLGHIEFANFMNLEDINVWQGAVGTVSLPHMDSRDNFLCQIVGHKDLVLVAPTQIGNLYTKNMTDWPSHYSPVNFFEPDLEKHPRFEDVKLKFNVRINPGDIVFIPSYWWHHIQSSKGKNMAINYWFSNNFMTNLLMEYAQDV